MAIEFEIIHEAARVYAEALYELADERGLVDDIEQELSQLERLWETESAFSGLMCSAAIDDDARRVSLRRIFQGRVHELVLNLVLVMNDKRRTMMFPTVCKAYRALINERRRRQQVFVTTAAALTEDLRKRISEQAGRISGMTPVLVERVDPAILGGLVLQVGDRVVDTSLRLRLRRMKQALSEQMAKHRYEGRRFFAAPSG